MYDNASSCMDDIQNVSEDEPISVMPTSLTQIACVVNSGSQSEFMGGKQSVLLSCEVENAPGSCGCETNAKSNEVRCQKEVMDKTIQELSSNKYAEFIRGVREHSIFVEIVLICPIMVPCYEVSCLLMRQLYPKVDSSLIRFVKGKGGSV